ncbi:hypothetical protein HKX48_000743 [Thoreauomyces humboldtii]|nr:hypothetical protein HKX48_000743 [Thoreauomyces humboldtii]
MIKASGRINVITNTSSEADSHLAARKFVRILKRIGFPVKFRDFGCLQLCAVMDVGFKIRLERLVAEHPYACTYEPELFTGLHYHMTDPKCSITIFTSGKVTFSGVKSSAELAKVVQVIHPVLSGCVLRDELRTSPRA